MQGGLPQQILKEKMILCLIRQLQFNFPLQLNNLLFASVIGDSLHLFLLSGNFIRIRYLL